jgi:hypothetical protein
MSTVDLSIWQRYRAQLPADTVALFFDVRLGEGRATPPDTPAYLQEFWYAVTAKRADVLVQVPGGVWLVELRDHAQPSAVGRLQVYGLLWKDDPVLAGALRLVLVTNYADPDVQRLCAVQSIDYVVV